MLKIAFVGKVSLFRSYFSFFSILNMNKTIKSETRKLLLSPISKFKEKQEDKAEFNQKQDCLSVVKEFIENLKDVAGVGAIVSTIQKLSDLEHKDRIITQKQYFEESESLTGVSLSTLNRIKKEGTLNEGIWSTPRKKQPHKANTHVMSKLIRESFESIIAGDWKKVTNHVINVENKYKERDRITEENLERFIINVGNSDTSGSESDESMHVEFLDFDSLE